MDNAYTADVSAAAERFPFPQEDEFKRLHGVTWARYEALLARRGDTAGPRISYLEGEVEVMSPGWPHEHWKKKLARLIEAWCDATGTRIEGAGSLTIKKRTVKRGAEPDECYVIGIHRKKVPDLAIEVVWTSGTINKLDLYRRLGVRELWIWRRADPSVIELYQLNRGHYVRVQQSKVLPKLDLRLLRRCMAIPDQFGAIRSLRAALKRRARSRSPESN